MRSCLYAGTVKHRRFSDKPHAFRYQVFMTCLDLSQLETVFKSYWLWSTQGRNLAAFKRERYLTNPEKPLLEIAKSLVQKEIGAQPDQIFLLTNLAFWGYVFNPISLYFCFEKGKFVACIAEVTNTPWGEKHPYVLKPEQVKNNIYRMSFKKALHVSPFLTMDYEYEMRCRQNADHLIVNIQNKRDGVCDFDANLNLKARPIGHVNLAKTLIRFPFMTGKVILGIHWQALKLWLKGVKVVDHG